MYNTFINSLTPQQYRCEVRALKRHTFKITIFDKDGQVGGDIVCLKYGYLEENIKKVKEIYKLTDMDISYPVEQPEGVRNVK